MQELNAFHMSFPELKLRSDLTFIQKKLDGLCRRADDIWHEAQDDGWAGSTELAGLTGALEGLADIVRDIRKEEE